MKDNTTDISPDGYESFITQVKAIEEFSRIDAENKGVVYKKKTGIYAEGDTPVYLYYIEKGKVKTVKNNRHEKELITGLYKQGDFFGYIALFENNVYEDAAIAMEDCLLKLIPKDDFYRLIHLNPDIANTFMKLLSTEVKEKEERLLQVVYGSVRKKVAESLIMLKEKYGNQNMANDLFSIHISREDLSHIAGTATETLIRTLTDFKDEGIIEMKGGTITIINSEKLRQMKN